MYHIINSLLYLDDVSGFTRHECLLPLCQSQILLLALCSLLYCPTVSSIMRFRLPTVFLQGQFLWTVSLSKAMHTLISIFKRSNSIKTWVTIHTLGRRHQVCKENIFIVGSKRLWGPMRQGTRKMTYETVTVSRSKVCVLYHWGVNRNWWYDFPLQAVKINVCFVCFYTPLDGV